MPKKVPSVGAWLGAGAYKQCYALGDDEVALIASSSYQKLKTDYQRLKDLEALGIPVVKARLGLVKKDKKRRKAIILPRYDEGGVRPSSLSDYRLNKTHKKQLRAIYNAIKKKKVDISDLQFLVRHGRKSHIVVTDPNGVDYNVHPEHNYSLGDLSDVMAEMRIRFKR